MEISDESDTWPVRLTRLNNKYRTVTEQKVKCETCGPLSKVDVIVKPQNCRIADHIIFMNKALFAQ